MSKKIIRIDIETAPLYPSEEEMPVDVMKVWKEKYREGKAEDQTPWEFFRDKSALYPEFSRIVCVSMGYEKVEKIANGRTDDIIRYTFTTKSCFGYDEKSLLSEVYDLLYKFNSNEFTLGGHNINEFDLGFLRKRMVITGVCTMSTFPAILDTLSKKPRDLDYADTMQLFKMGKNTATGLELMCLSLGIASPKDDIAGADVKDVFYSKADDALSRIVSYCEKDIYATYSCYCKMYGLEILPMDGYKPFIDEECKDHLISFIDGHGEDSIPLWAFVSLTGIEKPYLSRSDSKLFRDFMDRYTQRNKERNNIISSRNQEK